MDYNPLDICSIVKYPAAILQEPCKLIKDDMFGTDELYTLDRYLYATCRGLHALGVAANQINVSYQAFAFIYDEQDVRTIYNPWPPEPGTFEPTTNDMMDLKEGCLSLPSCPQANTGARFNTVSISGYDVDGQQVTYHLTGVPAAAVQHEYDHIQGILFVDHLPKFRRRKIMDKIKRNG